MSDAQSAAVDQQTREAFVADGVVHAKEAQSAPYAGPKLGDQPVIPVEGRNGQPPAVPQLGVTVLGRQTVQDVEPTEPQSILNQAMALSAMCDHASCEAFWAASGLLHRQARPSKEKMTEILGLLDEMASRAVQLRHSLSTHA